MQLPGITAFAPGARLSRYVYRYYLLEFRLLEEQPPLEERVLLNTNALLQDAVGRLYVEAAFSPEAKRAVTEIVNKDLAAFRARLENLDWMTDETKARALEKLDQMVVKVGYPDQWETYEAVEVGDSYAETVVSAGRAFLRKTSSRAGEPVDRTQWDAPAQIVNAFYNPSLTRSSSPRVSYSRPFLMYAPTPPRTLAPSVMLSVTKSRTASIPMRPPSSRLNKVASLPPPKSSQNPSAAYSRDAKRHAPFQLGEPGHRENEPHHRKGRLLQSGRDLELYRGRLGHKGVRGADRTPPQEHADRQIGDKSPRCSQKQSKGVVGPRKAFDWVIMPT